MSGAVRGEHSLLKKIKKRAVCNSEHFREGRFGRRGSRITAKSLDVGMTQHEVSAHFAPDERMGGAVLAEHTVRIGVEVCRYKNR